jgi:hypothetical protein
MGKPDPYLASIESNGMTYTLPLQRVLQPGNRRIYTHLRIVEIRTGFSDWQEQGESSLSLRNIRNKKPKVKLKWEKV